MPMIDSRTSRGARSRAEMRAATQASTTAAGPSSLGVSGRKAGQSRAVRLDDCGPDLGSAQVECKDRS